MDQHCDGALDCADHSDEQNCQLATIPNNYHKEQAPPGKRNLKTLVEVSIDLNAIFAIEELKMTLSLDFDLNLQWPDNRLTYRNLRADPHTNVLPVRQASDIWVPDLSFRNSIGNVRVTYDSEANIFINRSGPGNPTSIFAAEEEIVYAGGKNPLWFVRSYEVTFKCSFGLRLYPFDRQECFVDIEVAPAIHKYVGIKGVAFKYKGERSLVQFHVESWSLEQKNDSFLTGKIILQRNANYHIVTTFIPTVSLIVIAESTLFIDDSHFEANIMVALTAKLVTYTFYQSLASTLPKTSYLKMIDIWLLFGLVMPFLVFLHLALCEVFKVDSKVDQEMSQRKPIRKKNTRLQNIKRISKIANPVITAIFIIGFFANVASEVENI